MKKAADVIRHHHEHPRSGILVEGDLHPNETSTQQMTYTGSGPIRISLAWHDPPGAGQTQSSADRTPRLVNHLNLRLQQGSTTHEPFVMPFTTGHGATPAYDDSLRGMSATTGNNFTDNVKQVLVSNPTPGTYTVSISPSGNLIDNLPQRFSLVITGLERNTPSAPSISAVSPHTASNSGPFSLNIEGNNFTTGSRVFLQRDGSPRVEVQQAQLTSSLIQGKVDPTGMQPGYWSVVVSSPDHFETILGNCLIIGASSVILEDDFSSNNGWTLQGQWAIGAPQYSPSSGGPTQPSAGTKILGYNFSGNYANKLNPPPHAISPAYNLSDKAGVLLQFDRWLVIESSQFDRATISVSNNGTSWTTVWQNPESFLEDQEWVPQTIDISSIADGQSTVFIRFSMGPTDSAYAYAGWNVDRLRLVGTTAGVPPIFTSAPPEPAVVNVGQTFSYIATTSDPDTPAASLTFSATGLPPGFTWTSPGNGTAILSGIAQTAGRHSILLNVSDGAYTTYQELQLIIVPEDGNTPLVL